MLKLKHNYINIETVSWNTIILQFQCMAVFIYSTSLHSLLGNFIATEVILGLYCTLLSFENKWWKISMLFGCVYCFLFFFCIFQVNLGVGKLIVSRQEFLYEEWQLLKTTQNPTHKVYLLAFFEVVIAEPRVTQDDWKLTWVQRMELYFLIMKVARQHHKDLAGRVCDGSQITTMSKNEWKKNPLTPQCESHLRLVDLVVKFRKSGTVQNWQESSCRII